MNTLLTNIKLRLRSIFEPMRVTLDSNDNSVTINESLYNAMLQLGVKENNKILVFRLGKNFAFTINPELEKETQLASLQYNSEYKTIGFETLIPSVNSMFYEWGLDYGTIAKSVRVTYKNVNGLRCFVIGVPSVRQCEVKVAN